MRRTVLACVVGLVMFASAGSVLRAEGAGPYRVLKTAAVGGAGGFDYVYADVDGRRLYIARRGTPGRINVFDLDTLAPAGEIPNANAHGVAVDPSSHHGFGSSKPVVMFDTRTLATIKTIDVDGNPDGIFFEPLSKRVYVFSHVPPFATVINAADGSVAGTIDLGGMPEQAASDGKGHLYVDIEDMGNVAVVDVKTMKVTAHYDLMGKGGTCAGLALDNKNHVLFASCRMPQNMVVLNAEDGRILATLPIGAGTDGAAFNASTMEAFSAQRDGTLAVVKENSPTNFVLEQTVQTKVSGKTLTLDQKTGHILVIAADYEPPPPAPATPAPGGRGAAQGPMITDSFSILVVGK